jgi:hypothetical protein
MRNCVFLSNYSYHKINLLNTIIYFTYTLKYEIVKLNQKYGIETVKYTYIYIYKHILTIVIAIFIVCILTCDSLSICI